MDTKEKIAHLERLVAAAPEDQTALFMLGRELMNDGDFVRAAEVLARCCAAAPDYTAAWRHRGDALRRAGRAAEAIEAYEQGIATSERTGDLQTGKEMRVFLEKLRHYQFDKTVSECVDD